MSSIIVKVKHTFWGEEVKAFKFIMTSIGSKW